MLTGAVILIVVVMILLFVGRIGLQVKPASFLPYAATSPSIDRVPLPDDLPAPVRRYFQAIIGDQVPVITSAVITGTVDLRFGSLPMKGRFRFVHRAGQNYRHYIEATVFGIPVMKVNEWYLDGHSRLELPFGVVENESKVDMAANLGLWGESIWLPSIFVTDPRVRWEAVDDATARLLVPFGSEEDVFTATFDPQTGLLHSLEAMRYKDPKHSEKTAWRNNVQGWKTFHGMRIPSPGAVTWADDGRPWSVWTIEDIVYNVDVSEYVRARGV